MATKKTGKPSGSTTRKPASKPAVASTKATAKSATPEVIDAEVVEVRKPALPETGTKAEEPSAAPAASADPAKPAARESTPSSQPKPVPVSPSRGGGLPLALSVIALLGVGVVGAMQLGGRDVATPGNFAHTEELAALGQRLDARIDEIAATPAPTGGTDPALANRIDEVMATLDVLAAAVDAQSADMATLKAGLASLEAQVAGIEASAGNAAALPEDLQSEIAALRDQMQQAAAENADLNARLEETARAAEERLAGIDASAADSARTASVAIALARIEASLEDGSTFLVALDQIVRSNGPKPSAALSAHAASGVPTVNALRLEFDEAARAAIRAENRERQSGGFLERFTGFLRTQVNPRALEATDGSDASAVLSRAAAALAVPDLAKALTEVGTLSPAAAAAMASWTARAQARIDALAEFAEFAALAGREG